ncbi:MAG: 50S ribosomal protein L25 [Candidatus Pristimantibacillus sp.]
MSLPMSAELRTTHTKGELRSLRQQGKVPGVIFGKQLDGPVSIAVEEKSLQALLRSHPNAILDLNIPSIGKQPVMIADVQRDSLSRRVLHVDLHQISMNEEVKTQVRIDFVGEAKGVQEGGVLQVMVHELEVQCLPGSIPESIEVNVADLEIGHGLYVKDVIVPAGVEMKSDQELAIVAVAAPQKELSEEEAEEAAAELEAAESRSQEARLNVDKE